MNLADRVFHGASQLQTRGLGQEWGVVVDNEDPDGLGRVRVRLPWHQEDQATHWIDRLAGGGREYGETQGIPQAGELVALYFLSGNQHAPVYQAASWTVGGKGPLGHVPPGLPPRVYAQPAHKPAEGKYKTWFWRSISGFLLWVGEGLDWLSFRSPKGYRLDLEHDVPVGGKTKDDAREEPYHRLRLTTPSGHELVSFEHDPADRNDLSVQHRRGMRLDLLEKPRSGERTVRLTLDGLSLELHKATGQVYIRVGDETGQFVLLDQTAQTVTVEAKGTAMVTAPSVLIGPPGAYAPVARVGDQVDPVTHKIISGSPNVRSS